MRFLCSVSVVLLVLGCRGKSEKQSSDAAPGTSSVSTRSTTAKSDTTCFRQRINRDTTTVQLIISGNRVSGFLDINPYEKDRARGPFAGTLQGNHMRTDWLRSGEGATEKHRLAMIRTGDTLRWREEGPFVKSTTGKGWVATDVSNDFQYELIRTECTPTSLP